MWAFGTMTFGRCWAAIMMPWYGCWDGNRCTMMMLGLMGTSGEMISAHQMATDNKMAAANTIADANETLTQNETPAVDTMPTANPQLNEAEHQVPDNNIKREYPENTGIFRFVAGKLDISEWLE